MTTFLLIALLPPFAWCLYYAWCSWQIRKNLIRPAITRAEANSWRKLEHDESVWSDLEKYLAWMD